MADLGLPARARFVDFEGRGFTREEMLALAALPSVVRLSFKDCDVGDDEVRLLCGLPRLKSLWLEGTRVTDAVLVDAARLPKLDWLILDRTAVTGVGFAAFAGHRGLRTLWLSDTAVGDAAMPLLADIPRLSGVVIKRTRVTPAGLLLLARHPTVTVEAADQFTAAELAAFESEQRRQARRPPAGAAPSPAGLDEARAVLLGFFAAMAAWERAAAKPAASPAVGGDREKEQCAAVFEAFCTPKDRKYGRPNVIVFSMPPEYEDQEVVDAEGLSPRKACFYTKDRNDFQRRYFVVKKGDRWRVDHREVLLDGWERESL